MGFFLCYILPINSPRQAFNNVDTFDRIVMTVSEIDNKTNCRCQLLLLGDLIKQSM